MSESVRWRNRAGVADRACDAARLAAVVCASRPWPTRWKRRWPTPTPTIRSSTRSARWFAPPMKACRRRSPATGRGRSRRPMSACSRCRPRSARSARPRRATAPASYFTQSGVNTPHGVGATVTQNLLNGFQTANRTRLAESQVFAARETLRNIEQTVLLNATTAYMNLLRDAGILELQRSNLEVLTEQLRQTNAAAAMRQRHRDRRVAGGSPPQRRPHPVVCRRGQLRELPGGLPAGDRARPRQACAGGAGRPLLARNAARGDGRRHRAKPRSSHRAAQRRRRHPIRSRSPRARSIRPCRCKAACRRTTSRR